MGIIVSYIYIFLLLVLSKILPFKKEEYSRKFVHILSANWWVICMIYFNNIYEPLFVCFSFLIVNIINHRYTILTSIRRKEDDGWGEIFYSIGLILLVCFSYIMSDLKLGLFGALAIGYADGFAALIGQTIPSKRFYNNKTLAGSSTFFIITILIYHFINPPITFSYAYIIEVILVSFMLTLIEFLSSKGLDNIFIPIFSTIFYVLLV
ncbi:MAG: hypothetical protein ATN31_05720 [Candidatus Epulonipiscioides saccharophilum]|nr:MAG: hypothetical protein ATN31_05720 [Epulopiscium sp. AS2M-Bin001]